MNLILFYYTLRYLTVSSFRVGAIALIASSMVLLGCGGGGGGGGSDSASTPLNPSQLPAPLLYLVSNNTNTLVVIGNGAPTCAVTSLYIKDGANEQKINLGATAQYTNPSNSVSLEYSYTCTAEGVETPRSRVAKLPNMIELNLLSWGAMSLADFNGDSIYELLGTLGTSTTPTIFTEAQLGLGDLRLPGRAYRDIRFADFNNDGYLDAIANVYSENRSLDPNYNSYVQLYWGQANGRFLIDAAFSAQQYTGYGETIVVADLDNDGYVDILVPQYKIPGSSNPYSRNLLFKNNRDKTFTEVAVSAGIAATIPYVQPEGAQALDFNEDGLIDLYVSGGLFKNLGNFQFSDIGPSIGLPRVFEEGAKFFDYDLDGDLDFLMNPGGAKPRLFININGQFVEKSPNPFPDEFFRSVFGMQTGDFNGDGYEDVMLAGGLALSGVALAPRLYLNLNGTFVRQPLIADGLGWSDLVSLADLNNDGALDILARYNAMRVLVNQNIPNYYIKIVVTSSNNKNQFGRMVRATYPDGKVKVMVIDGGSGFMSNQPYPVLIPNDSGATLSIEISCFNKKIIINAVSGTYSKDCS
jgi:hypothetical protein